MINIKKILNFIINLYQIFLSPIIGNRCRFTPSCSKYMSDSIKRYGPISGGLLGLKRLLRCHPWEDGGYDPVIKLTDSSINNLEKSQINRFGDDRTT